MKNRMNGDDEVVEMEQDKDGSFKAVAVRKVAPNPYPLPMMFNNNIRRQSVMLQILDGFVIGLDAIDRIIERMERMKKGRRR